MAAAVVLFQSQRAENALTAEDESAIRGLLEVWGKNDSLGYFATRRDKSVIFAPTAERRSPTVSRSASAWPAGTRSGSPRVARSHRRVAGDVQRLRLDPGVMGASSTGAQSYREAGLSALQLGDEAILYPDKFRLSGADMRGFARL